MKLLVVSDRDGTINKDENYYLGSSKNWKAQVSFLEQVVEGIKLIKSIPDAKFYIVTNQSGVALKGEKFEDLNEDRMHEVNKYIISRLGELGAIVDGYFACPYVDEKYKDKALSKGLILNEEYIVNNHPDLKPNPGMINQAIQKSEFKDGEYVLFMIGDRLIDMQAGINAKAKSILICSYKTKELGDVKKAEKYKEKIFMTDNFLGAAAFIVNTYKKYNNKK